MAENYREQQQEEAEGIVDAGGFENDPGTGMIAEDQETAAMADAQYDVPAEAPFQNDEEAIEETEASENVQVDLHEDSGSGVDIAVVVIILLVIIGCLSFAYANAPTEEEQQYQQIIAQQQAAKKEAAEKEYESPYEVVELSEGVAAVVNGEVITEETVDEYVAGFRKLYGLENDEDWAAWLISYDYSPEQVRDIAISTYVDDMLVSQAIEEYGIVASQESIDEIYNAARENFATEEEWQKGLEQASLTEESFREQCKQQAEQEALKDYLGDRWFATPEDENAEMLVAVRQYYPEYADVESLDGIDAEKLEPVHDMVMLYAKQDAYDKFLTDARANADIKMSAAPEELGYNTNLLMGLFRSLTMQMEAAQQQAEAE